MKKRLITTATIIDLENEKILEEKLKSRGKLTTSDIVMCKALIDEYIDHLYDYIKRGRLDRLDMLNSTRYGIAYKLCNLDFYLGDEDDDLLNRYVKTKIDELEELVLRAYGEDSKEFQALVNLY